MQSKAHSRFVSIHQRSIALLDLHRRLSRVNFTKEPKKIAESELADLTRASVVLSVAAMDSYFTARFAECLVPFLKKHGVTDKLVELLNKAGLDTRRSLEMIQMERPYRRVRTLMDAHLERYTTQKTDVINSLFIAYGIKDLCGNAQKYAKRRNLIKRVEILTDRRHQIVHEGDVNSQGKLNRIVENRVRAQLKDIKVFVDAAHSIIDKRIGK